MFRTATTIAALIALVSGAAAQTLAVTPNPVPTGQEVQITFTNNTLSTLNLPSSTPWAIHDRQGNVVHKPWGLPSIVALPPSMSVNYAWDQMGGSGLVKPDGYEVRFDYFDANWTKQTLIDVFQINDDVMVATTSVAIGGTAALMLDSKMAPQLDYVVACSFGKKPGLSIGGNRVLELAVDPLFATSVASGLPMFENFKGKLSATGTALAKLHVPFIPALSGSRIYAAYVTLSAGAPSGIFSYSAAQTIKIQ